MGAVTIPRSVPILRDPAFARIWFIQASTQVGGNMALYALTILVFDTTRSNAAVSALVMSFLIPTILLSARWRLSRAEHPISVPPVPRPAISMSISGQSRTISSAVPSSCARGFAGLPYWNGM